MDCGEIDFLEKINGLLQMKVVIPLGSSQQYEAL